jgi:protein-S-isoprenylcysteine O-methyltransferase Ste14
MQVKTLVGSGEKIGLFVLPFALVGVVLNLAAPSAFGVGGPPGWLHACSWIVLIVGLVVWAWSAGLILIKVPRGELITSGPFRLVRHPLYTGVSLLVLPWLGFLLDTWLGAFLGVVMYLATRMYGPIEEEALASRFGETWERYRGSVLFPRL